MGLESGTVAAIIAGTMAAASTATSLISSSAAAANQPDEPEMPVMPSEEAKEPISKAVREEEQRKLRQRRYLSGTVLTSPLGAQGVSGGGGNSLLGDVGK